MYYSHNGILLVDHLKVVGDLAYEKVKELSISRKYCWLPDVSKIIGYTHDFGKYTSFFQEHLKGKKHGIKSHHSLLSALFCSFQIEHYLKNFSSSHDNITKFLPLIGYIVIHRHHGDLRSPEEVIPRNRYLTDDLNLTGGDQQLYYEIKALNEQIDDMYKNLEKIAEDVSNLGFKNLEKFLKRSTVKYIFCLLDKLRYELIEKCILTEAERLELYFITILLFSLLIDSDKKSAGRESPVKSSRRKIPSYLVDKYIEEKFRRNLTQLEINKLRNKVYESVTKKVENLSLKQRLFTLTAPTGSGKTLTALSFALKLREKIEMEKGMKPRIIYALPFINIVEQNYDVFQKVLSQLEEYNKNSSSFLIKHHHLASIEYKEDNQYKSVDESLLLIESWESEIVVTTFVQLLHSIIGYKNSFLKKVSNIVGSIIILDEVQTIPVEYWKLVEKVFESLAEVFDCRIILMTATKPLIFSSDIAIELLDEKERFFSKLDRVSLIPLFKKGNQELSMTDNDFIEWFKSNYQKNKSYLIVVNTISKSKVIYRLLREELGLVGFREIDDEDNERNIFEEEFLLEKLLDKKNIFYLSTNITPIQRFVRVKVLKNFLEKGGKAILVSTQVVEAGVDLDFDIVIRDIGPLDSIIQCAGRCNRNGVKQEKGKVYIVSLEDGQAELIYGKIHPFVSRKLLTANEIKERDFFKLADSFFKEIQNRISWDKAKKIYDAMLDLNFYHKQISSIADFQLITEKGEFFDIFIELDKKSCDIRNNFIEKVIHEKELLKKREQFLKFRKDFYDYVIQVRKENIIKNWPIRLGDTEYFFVPYNQLSIFYDIETGFKTESGTIIF